jgi:uncharacterized membrane-anchored protein
VEIISVVPITYYVVGLVGYLSKAMVAAGSHIEPEIVEGVALPIVAASVIWVVRRAHHKIAGDANADQLEL